MLQGQVDTVEIDPIEGVLRAEGRDLTSRLIEARTQETFANRTASEIAELLATRHDLQADVYRTNTPVGRYYQNEHDRITLNQFSRATTEWDLLTYLARQEGFDVFVSGDTLHFQPRSTDSPTLTLTPRSVLALKLERSLTLARDIEVTVKSWNSRQQNAFVQTARAQGRAGQSQSRAGGPPQRYVFVYPNLTSDEALKLAQQKLAELSRHERVVVATMPGELALTARSVVALSGTSTDFDQTYFVDSVDRSVHVESGFVQHLRLKNAKPQSETTPPGDLVVSVTN